MTTSRRPTGRAGPRRSAHSTRATPSRLALVEEPAARARRPHRRGGTGPGGTAAAGPAYSVMSTNVGELTMSVIPSPTANPFANCVLPAPRSPTQAQQVARPGDGARRAASERVLGGVARRHDELGDQGAWTSVPRVAEPGARRLAPGRGAATGAVRRAARGRRSGRPPVARRRAPRCAASRMHVAREPARSRRAPGCGPRARRWARCGRGPSRPGRGQRPPGSVVEDERGRIDEQRDLRARQPLEQLPPPGPGMGRRTAPSRARTPNGAGGVERRALAALRCLEVAQLLAGQRRHDDAADAHGARPREGLGVDPRADHEDAAGSADVDPARPQLAERVRGELQPAARGGARREARRGARGPPARTRMLGTRPDLGDGAAERASRRGRGARR